MTDFQAIRVQLLHTLNTSIDRDRWGQVDDAIDSYNHLITQSNYLLKRYLSNQHSNTVVNNLNRIIYTSQTRINQLSQKQIQLEKAIDQPANQPHRQSVTQPVDPSITLDSVVQLKTLIDQIVEHASSQPNDQFVEDDTDDSHRLV